MDKLAAACGLDPVDIRLLIAMETGDTLITGQVIENVVIDSMPGQAMTLAGQTTGSSCSICINGKKNVIIRNVTLRGRQFGILATDTVGLSVQNATILDANYCGICLFGGSGGRITTSNISNIGLLRNSLGEPTYGGVDGRGTAYGYKFEVASQNSGTSGIPTNWIVSGGSVRNVPLWMGVNAHQCSLCTVQNVDVSGAPRAFFWVGTVTNSNLTNNTVHDRCLSGGTSCPGSFGSGDIQSFLYGSWSGGSITGNQIGSSYSMPQAFGSNSGVNVSGNVRVGQ